MRKSSFDPILVDMLQRQLRIAGLCVLAVMSILLLRLWYLQMIAGAEYAQMSANNFIHKVASAGLPVNIKKGQFLSPWEMKHVTNRAKATGRSWPANAAPASVTTISSPTCVRSA